MCVGSKKIDPLFDGLDGLYHHAKFGEDRTTHADCRFENVVFDFVYNAPSLVGYTLNSYCVAVYGSIFIPFQRFSEVIALSEPLDISYFRR